MPDGQEEEAQAHLLRRLAQPQHVGVGEPAGVDHRGGQEEDRPTFAAAWKVPTIPGAAGIISPTTSTVITT